MSATLYPTHHARAAARVLIATALFFISVGLGPPAGAQATSDATPRTWSLKPATADGPDSRPDFTFELPPGGSTTDHVAVTNFGDQPVDLRLYAADAFTPSDGGFDLLAGSRTSVDAGSWIRLTTDSVRLAARETSVIALDLTVPANATPGDHAAGVVATLTESVTDSSGNRVAIEHRVGARVYLRVAGALEPELTIDPLRVSWVGTSNPFGRGQVDVGYTVHNRGNVRLAARQVVTVKGPGGFVLTRMTPDDLAELLPGATAERAVRLPGVAPGGYLTVEVRLAPYQPRDGTTSPIVGRSHPLWALPWTSGVLVLGAGSGLWLRQRRPRRVGKHVRRGAS
jgi:hypothetical protein